MEQKFERIREVLGIFGEDAFYSIDITQYSIRFQGYISKDSVRFAEELGYTRDKSINFISYKKENCTLIFT
jgi:hypothetical protein